MCFCCHGFDQGYSINGVLFFFHNLRGKKNRKKKKRDNFIFVLYHGFDQDYSSNGFVYLIVFVLGIHILRYFFSPFMILFRVVVLMGLCV